MTKTIQSFVNKKLILMVLGLAFFVPLANVHAQVTPLPAGTKTDYAVGGNPYGVAFDNITNSIWVANINSDTVSKVDINTGTRIDYVVGTRPYGIAFDNITNSVWVTSSHSDIISKIDINTGMRIDYPVGYLPVAVAFDNVTRSVWVANQGSDTVSKVDIYTGSKTDYPVGSGPVAISFDNVTNSVWLGNLYTQNVSKVDIYTGAITAEYLVADSPFGVAFDNITKSVWVTNAYSDIVSKVDINTGTRIDYPVGSGPFGVTFDNITNSVWVVNSNSDTVSKVDINTGVMTDYSTGITPDGVTFDNVTNSVWVANAGSNTVSKIAIGVSIGVLQPSQFWSQVIHPNGKLNFRQTAGTKITGTQIDKLDIDVIKTVPSGWVLKVATTTDAVTGQPVEIDGYEWYGVVDMTDGAVGWMASKDLSTGTIYLPYDVSIQSDLEAKATTTLYQTKETRIPVITQAVDNYYTTTTISNTLYGGGGGLDGYDNFQTFIQESAFPKELILAITAEESGNDEFNNEICAGTLDGGVGIMQITSTGAKGLGSGLFNKLKLGDCNEKTTEWVGFQSQFYSNAFQGIYANIKDGFRVLQDKFAQAVRIMQNPKIISPCSLVIENTEVTCMDLKQILTVWGYNGFGKNAQGNYADYLGRIAQKLKDLNTYFVGTIDSNNQTALYGVSDKLTLANNNKQLIKLNSPGELQVIDSENNITGVVDGIMKEDIPLSLYEVESKGVAVFFPGDIRRYKVVGTSDGEYGLDIDYTKNGVLRIFKAISIPTTFGEIHEYLIDWDALDRGERGVTVQIDTNADGIVDRIVQSDATLTEIEPPVISIISPIGDNLFNSQAQVQFTVTDVISGIASTTATFNGITVVDGQFITLTQAGTNTLEVTAMDNEGNSAITTTTFNVLYITSGFLSPIKSDGTGVYNQGRTLPVKFNLVDANNNPISQALVYLYIAKISDSVVGNDEIPLSTSASDTGNQFRYDTSGKLYIFNLSTDTMTPGSWQIKAVLDSGQVITSVISIK